MPQQLHTLEFIPKKGKFMFTKKSIKVFIAVLFITTQKHKWQHRCPSTVSGSTNCAACTPCNVAKQ